MKKLLLIPLLLATHTLFPTIRTPEAESHRTKRLTFVNPAIRKMGYSNDPLLWTLLVDDEMDPNMRINPKCMRTNPQGATTQYNLLQFATLLGIQPAITLLVDAGADVDCACPTYGDTLSEVRRNGGSLTQDQFDDAIFNGKKQRLARIGLQSLHVDQALEHMPTVLIALIKTYMTPPPPAKPGATIEEIA